MYIQYICIRIIQTFLLLYVRYVYIYHLKENNHFKLHWFFILHKNFITKIPNGPHKSFFFFFFFSKEKGCGGENWALSECGKEGPFNSGWQKVPTFAGLLPPFRVCKQQKKVAGLKLPIIMYIFYRSRGWSLKKL